MDSGNETIAGMSQNNASSGSSDRRLTKNSSQNDEEDMYENRQTTRRSLPQPQQIRQSQNNYDSNRLSQGK